MIEDLVEWQPDPDVVLKPEDNKFNSKGWSVEEMFRINAQLGVTSSYEGVNDKYCTAEPEGNEEQRRQADVIAREIEENQESQRNCLLENDDDERDIDKETLFNKASKRYNTSSYNRNKNDAGPSNGRTHAGCKLFSVFVF